MAVIYESGLPLTTKSLIRAWLPLWLSWFAMAIEFPIMSSFICRMENPQLNLAALGGVIIPIAFIIEAPIIMLLSASTALCRDKHSYHFLFRAMMVMGLILTTIHLLVGVTPLYSLITVHLLGLPLEITHHARIGFCLLLFWTWTIAHRRFHQGILIRNHTTRLVAIGTGIRLLTGTVITATLAYFHVLSGSQVVGAALAVAVVAEAIFVRIVAQPAIQILLKTQTNNEEPLNVKKFLRFYTPLMATSFLDFSIQPICSAALARMPLALESLATFPVYNSLSFALRSPSYALTEIAIAHGEKPESRKVLHSFALALAVICMTMIVVIGTPLGANIFLIKVLGLAPHLAQLTSQALLLASAVTLLSPSKALFQGLVVKKGQTRSITEAALLFLLVAVLMLLLFVQTQTLPGALAMGIAFSCAALGQNYRLWRASRS